jgi:glycosyl transferase family 25
MKAWCINLDRRPDRWAHVMAEAGRAGITIERLPAVDAKHPEVAAAAAKVEPTIDGLPMSGAAFACFASHRLGWQRLLESGDSHGIIMEDDLNLSPGIGRLMGTDWIPADADIVKLETWGTRCHVARAAAGTVDGRTVSRLLSTHIGGGCYILSRAAAERLFAETRVYRDPVDELLFNDQLAYFRTAVIYQVSPALAVQGNRPHSDAGQGGAGTEAWTQSSIAERFSVEAAALEARREGLAGRLVRRLREELRAVRLGSRYAVVPFR